MSCNCEIDRDRDAVVAGLIDRDDIFKMREAVNVEVEKIYDSCREKDCVRNADVLFKNPECVQKLINKAINIKVKDADVLDVFVDTEPVPFKRGFFTVDVKFFIKVTFEVFLPNRDFSAKIVILNGLVLFDKKIVLFGSEGNVKSFKSIEGGNETGDTLNSTLISDNNPIAKIDVAEPIALNAKLVDICHECCRSCECAPKCVIDRLGNDVEDDDLDEPYEELDEGNNKKIVVTLGLFSIVKLIRNVQLLIPAFNFGVPNKRCLASTDQNPCELFEGLGFPIDEFFPPQVFDFPGALETEKRLREVSEHEERSGCECLEELIEEACEKHDKKDCCR